MDKLKDTFKEVLITIVPMSALILLISAIFAPMDSDMLISFIGGVIMMTIGMTFFLFGANISMMEVGSRFGSFIVQKRSMLWLIGLGFVVGLVVTIAEPDLQVLASQVNNVSGGDVGRILLTGMVGVGVGIFLVFALLRIVLRKSLYMMLLIGYLSVFTLSLFTSPTFYAISFDSGGVTTGPMTVPFILALGHGLAGTIRTSKEGNDSFGMVGLCSLGPIMAVLILGVFFR